MLTPSTELEEYDMPRVLVSKVGPLGYSETFIANHAERLPGVVGLHEGMPPMDSQIYQGVMRRVGLQGASLRSRRYWKRVLAKYAPEVVLAEHGQTAVSMMGACRDIGIPLVAHFHGSDAWVGATVSGHRHLYRRLFRKAAAIVVASASMAGRLRELGAPYAKLHLIRIGVDVGEIAPSDPAAAPPHFIGVGRFVECKGHEETIRAFKLVHQERPAARLTIFGDGPLLSKCKAMVQADGLNDVIFLPGSQNHTKVMAALGRGRSFVHHGLVCDDGSREGGPIVVAEAQAAGLPVVATPSGGIPEMVEDGRSGLLVAERDLDAMATAMIRLVDFPELARTFGQVGRVRVTRDQDSTVVTGALAAVLKSARDSTATTS